MTTDAPQTLTLAQAAAVYRDAIAAVERNGEAVRQARTRVHELEQKGMDLQLRFYDSQDALAVAAKRDTTVQSAIDHTTEN
jgi:hypothetical protein